MSQNDQIHFKNLAANATRFLKCLTILRHYAYGLKNCKNKNKKTP